MMLLGLSCFLLEGCLAHFFFNTHMTGEGILQSRHTHTTCFFFVTLFSACKTWFSLIGPIFYECLSLSLSFHELPPFASSVARPNVSSMAQFFKPDLFSIINYVTLCRCCSLTKWFTSVADLVTFYNSISLVAPGSMLQC